MEAWQKFNDPVYGTAVFRQQRRGLKDYWGRPSSERRLAGNLVDAFKDIFSTVEFSRLAYLRQSGLTYLVFPSAVHTRFAHSWGCLYLGDQALSHIHVQGRSGFGKRKRNAEQLYAYLKSRGLIDEFLVSLLLHDVGHMPFSHLLEESELYSDISHEEIGCELILGKGEYFESMKDSYGEMWGGGGHKDICFLSDSLNRISDLDKFLVCALISGNKDYLEHSTVDGASYDLLSNLVSGLLDLDRIDHYQRDILHTGLRIASPDPVALMADMRIIYDDSEQCRSSCDISLEELGVLQARNLLQAKSLLTKFVFKSSDVMSYHSMLRQAVEMHVESISRNKSDVESVLRKISSMTDDELLSELKSSYDSEARSITRRILNRNPYATVGRFEIRNNTMKYDPGALKRKRTECVERLLSEGIEVSESDILLSPPSGYYRSSVGGAHKGWLELSHLVDAKGIPLLDHATYKQEFTPFRDESVANKYDLYICTSRHSLVEKVRNFFDSNEIRYIN